MPVLEVQSLRKRYGTFTAVHDASFSVEEGSIFGLLGPNGSGKTTTLACALGLLRPTSGTISVLGHTADRLHRTRGRVGVVFDDAVLVRGLTVQQELEYARRLFGYDGGRTVEDSLELVGIPELASRPVTRLSLGQRKRMAVAGALVGSPELVVLDEPLSGLDPLGVRQFLRLLQRLASEGTTFVLSSHRLHEMQPVLTHAAILIAGRVALSGSLEELLAGKGPITVDVDDPDAALVALRPVELDAKAEGARVTIQPGTLGPGEINRLLVEAGVEVRGLGSSALDLPGLFSSLVDGLDSVKEEGA